MQPAASAMSNWPRTNLKWVLLGKGRGAGAKLQLSSNAKTADISKNGHSLGQTPRPRRKGCGLRTRKRPWHRVAAVGAVGWLGSARYRPLRPCPLRDTARFCDRLYEMCSAQSSPWKNAPCLRGRLRRPLGNNRGVRRGLWAVKIHEATTVPTSGP